MNQSQLWHILKHHLSHCGGHFLSWGVVPDELWVFVRSLKYLYRRLSVVSHRIHKHTGKETHQCQTHLKERTNISKVDWAKDVYKKEAILEAKLRSVQADLWSNQLVWGHLGEQLCSLGANLWVCAVTEEVQQIDQSTYRGHRSTEALNNTTCMQLWTDLKKLSGLTYLWP